MLISSLVIMMGIVSRSFSSRLAFTVFTAFLTESLLTLLTTFSKYYLEGTVLGLGYSWKNLLIE